MIFSRQRIFLAGFVTFFFTISSLWALTIPDHPVGYVHDEAHLLTSEQAASLESKLADYERESSNQFVVATFPSLEGESLEDFSVRLAEKWKIGQKGRDNGVILLIFPQDRLMRIEVGYGLEAVIPDAYASQIVNHKLKPAFRQGDFFGGISAAIDSLIAASRGVYEPIKQTRRKSTPLSSLLIFIIFLLFPFALSFKKYGLRKTLGSSGVWTYGGGGFGGGSWGGGGFGGGGGSFGGGGSSGSW